MSALVPFFPRIPPWRRGRLLTAVICGVVAAAVVAWAPFADEDDLGDVVGFLRSLADGLGSVRWRLIPLLAMLTLVHYVLGGVALRAGAGGGLPLREATLVQFAAAAANRLTPPGVGGAAVNVRYLVRRSRPATEAVGVVAAVNLLGALADGLLLLTVLGVGWATGAGRTPITAIGSGVSRLAVPIASPIALRPHAVVWIAGIAAALPAIACWIIRQRRTARRRSRTRAAATAVANAFAAAARIRHRPRDLATLLVSSAGTTLVLGIAFAIALMAIPHGPPASRFTVLLGAYLIGAAAGSAAPTPAGMGSTETALTTMLLAADVTVAPAIQAVLLFRLLTFWAPVPIGILAAARLRRQHAL